jgi:hypothetical protein
VTSGEKQLVGMECNDPDNLDDLLLSLRTARLEADYRSAIGFNDTMRSRVSGNQSIG